MTGSHPSFFLAQYNLGLSLSRNGEDKDALAALNKALQLKIECSEITDFSILNSTAVSYIQNGDLTSAEEILRIAVEPAVVEKLVSSRSKSMPFTNLGHLLA